MPSLSRGFWLLIVLCGVALGLAAAEAAGLRAAEGAPAGWTRTEATVPFRRADLMGALPEGDGAWSLDHFMSLASEGALAPGESLRLVAELPPGGELLVFPAASWSRADAVHSLLSSTQAAVPRGGAVVLRRSRGGLADGRRVANAEETVLGCSGSLSPPGPDPVTLTLTQLEDGFEAIVGERRLACRNPDLGDQVVVRSGLQRVRVLELGRGETLSSPTGPARRALWLLGGLVGVLALSLVEVRSGADPRKVALTTAPLLLCGVALGVEGRAMVEQLRAPGLSPAMVGVWAGLAPALAAKGVHHAARLSRSGPLHGLLGPLGLAGATLLAVILARPLHWGAGLYLGGAGLAVGAVVWANARAIRGLNLVSLVGLACALGLAEYGARFTEAGIAWSPTGRMELDQALGWTNTAVSEFEQLEAGQHPDYPEEGYPVAVPERQAGRRVVCLGGSSTGGAYQNDDLDDFYPARLGERLGPEVEVVNQGVGGWNTFHIRTYLERSLDVLAPDVLTLYVGHNDLLTRSRLPYRELHARWQQGGGTGTLPLGSLRLYQGLRHLVGALVQREERVAVPIAHAEDNLEAISEMAAEQGARVLLITEATHPHPRPQVAYGALLDEVAGRHDHVASLDGSTHLLGLGSGMFLDDCHLTDRGHRALAAAIEARLVELGWMP